MKVVDVRTQTNESAIPAWVKLGGAGRGTVALARWVPVGIDAVLILAGALMMVGALAWARVWVTRLVPREPGSSTAPRFTAYESRATAVTSNG